MLKVSKILKNHVIFCLDSSGSMSGMRKNVVNVCNKWFGDLREQSKKHNQETIVTFITFANKAELKFKNKSPDKLKLDEDLYVPDGMTALFDGVKLAINHGNTLDDDYSHLVVVVTDGLENNSSSGNVIQAPNWIKNYQNKGNWSFVFLLPPGNALSFSSKYNLLSDNVREWTSDSEGLKKVEQLTTSGLSNYYSSRASGKRSVKNFFADLSSVTTGEVKRNLDDVTNNCEIYNVDKEAPIKQFVEKKTRRPYKIGSAYYQLSKPELIQASKDLLIMRKGESKIYGGYEARQLLGFPNGDVKVSPLDLSKWDLFCLSTSVNRKLVRGTKVIVKE